MTEQEILQHIHVVINQTTWNSLIEENCYHLGKLPLTFETDYGKTATIGQACFGQPCLNIIIPFREQALNRNWRDVRDDCPALYGGFPTLNAIPCPCESEMLSQAWSKQVREKCLQELKERKEKLQKEEIKAVEFAGVKSVIEKLGLDKPAFEAVQTTLKFLVGSQVPISIEAYGIKVIVDIARRQNKISGEEAKLLFDEYCKIKNVKSQQIEEAIHMIDQILADKLKKTIKKEEKVEYIK